MLLARLPNLRFRQAAEGPPGINLFRPRVIHAIPNGEMHIWHIVSFAIGGLR